MLEAHGGVLSKLTSFAARKELSSYTYLKSPSGLNLDFEEGAASLTPYNAADKKLVKKGEAPRKGAHAEFAPYSNICGLLALSSTGLPLLEEVHEAILAVQGAAPPAYD